MQKGATGGDPGSLAFIGPKTVSAGEGKPSFAENNG
jgi:hypothetical protein